MANEMKFNEAENIRGVVTKCYFPLSTSSLHNINSKSSRNLQNIIKMSPNKIIILRSEYGTEQKLQEI